MTRVAFVVAIVLASFLSPSLAVGEHENCGNREAFIRSLEENYGEVLLTRAHSLRDAMVEMFGSEAGTWTLLITKDGKTCLVDAGEWWNLALPPEQSSL